MALIKCKNCGKDISDTVNTCIHCGEPINKRDKEKSSTSWFKRHKCISILLLALLIGISAFLVYGIIKYKNSSIIHINGDSMAPTLKNGEIRLYNKTDKIDRFDIVIFIDSHNNTLVKRVYGLPGETISINDGLIQIDSKKIIEDKYANGSMKGNYSVTLENDEYYVLGDNRNNSLDSRYFGPIKKSSIKGKLYD